MDDGQEFFVMHRQTILDRLHADYPGLHAKYAIQSLVVFGSIARGDDREGSDVDILVTFEGPATFRAYMGLKLDLEVLLGCRVDLLTPKSLSPEMKAEIDKEAILAS
jgi:predicted nucleotidyltransferase